MKRLNIYARKLNPKDLNFENEQVHKKSHLFVLVKTEDQI